MINDQDRRVIETMAQCGCEAETLFSMFPKVPREDIIAIKNSIVADNKDDSDVGKISINCS